MVPLTTLYRFPCAGGWKWQLQDGWYDIIVTVHDAAALDAAAAAGYHATPAAAKDAHAASLVPPPADAPTRAELEQKATELGLKFDGRTPDKKLGEQIAAALKS